VKIIITGASGNYGQQAVRKLLKVVPPEDLILITRTPAKLAELAEMGLDIRQGDFDEPASLPEAFRGGEKMLLISGTRVGARVAQHKAAIDAAAAVGVKHIAYTSIVGIAPGNPAKVIEDHGPTEEMMRISGMAWTALRDQHYTDAMVINAGPNFVKTGIWPTSTAGGLEAPAWRDDCVNAAVAVLTGTGHENKIYNITGPELLNFEQYAEILSEAAGRPIRLLETDDEGMYEIFDAMGIPREPIDNLMVNRIPWNSNDMVSFERAIREGYLEVISDDVEMLTGEKPRSVLQMAMENAALLQGA
jgi:NAD(P)H dehydrogenase (quinone)